MVVDRMIITKQQQKTIKLIDPPASVELKGRRLGAHERTHWRDYHLNMQRVPAVADQMRAQLDRGHLQLSVRQQVVNVQHPVLP